MNQDKEKLRRLATIGNFANLPRYQGVFSVAAIRHLVFQSKPRFDSKGNIIPGNGLAEAGAILRVGRRVLIDLDRFDEWLDAHRDVA